MVMAAAVAVVCVVAAASSMAAHGAPSGDAYDVLLRSSSLDDQRAALGTIAATPRPYLPRLRQSLRDYARLIVSDPRAASRAVTLATYLRDTVFVRLLVESLGQSGGDAGCSQTCPAVLALTVHAAFGDWRPPIDLNPGIPAVRDFQVAVERMPHLSLAAVPVQSLLSGGEDDAEIATVAGKTERQLIDLAGPRTASPALRRLAAHALEASVASSTNRRDLYVLAMNDLPDTPGGEYLKAIHEAIYRAEFARTHGR